MSGLNLTVADKKRIREIEEEDNSKVQIEFKVKVFWDHSQDLKKLQELELESKMIQERIRKREGKFPDLKQLEGITDKFFREKFWKVQTVDGEKTIPGENAETAKEAYNKRVKKAKENSEKQKKKAAETKAAKSNKMETQ
jgi:hypothetical protein